MSTRVKIVIVAVTAVVLALVFALGRWVQQNLELEPPPVETVATVPRFTVSPDATIAPGFGPDEFPIIPVG